MADDVTADDWVTLGVALLKREGPGALDVADLCARLGCDLADFRSHFADKGAYALAVARHWADEGEAAAREARRGKKPSERLLAMLALGVEADVDLERGVRALAADHPDVAELVRGRGEIGPGVEPRNLHRILGTQPTRKLSAISVQPAVPTPHFESLHTGSRVPDSSPTS